MTQITPSLQEITCGDATKTLEELPQAQLRILCLQVKSPARRNDRGWGVFAKSVDAGRDASRGCPGVNIRERVRMGFQRDIQGATRRNVDGAARRIIHLLAQSLRYLCELEVLPRRKGRPSNWSPSSLESTAAQRRVDDSSSSARAKPSQAQTCMDQVVGWQYNKTERNHCSGPS